MKFVKELQDNQLLKDYVITVDNANVFYSKVKDKENCSKCKGINECLNDSQGFYTDVVLENNIYKAVLKTCQYKIQLKLETANKSLIKTLFMPKEILDARLENYEITTNTRKKIFDYINKFVLYYSRQDFKKGLALIGQFRIGKTFVLSAMANELSKRNISSLIIYFPDMARELKGALGTSRFDGLINLLKDIDILIIDDLGAEMMTPWLRDEVISPIINYRTSAYLPIFISSNLSIDQLTSHFSKTREGIDNIKGLRIMERLKEMMLFVDIPDGKFKQ